MVWPQKGNLFLHKIHSRLHFLEPVYAEDHVESLIWNITKSISELILLTHTTQSLYFLTVVNLTPFSINTAKAFSLSSELYLDARTNNSNSNKAYAIQPFTRIVHVIISFDCSASLLMIAFKSPWLWLRFTKPVEDWGLVLIALSRTLEALDTMVDTGI